MRERRAVAGDSLLIFEARRHSRIVSLRLIFCMGANYWQWAHDTICRRPSWRAEKLRVLPQIGVSAERCAPHCRCDEAGLRAPAFAHDRPAAMSVILRLQIPSAFPLKYLSRSSVYKGRWTRR